MKRRDGIPGRRPRSRSVLPDTDTSARSRFAVTWCSWSDRAAEVARATLSWLKCEDSKCDFSTVIVISWRATSADTKGGRRSYLGWPPSSLHIMTAGSFGIIRKQCYVARLKTSSTRHTTAVMRDLGALPQSISRRSKVKLSCWLSESNIPGDPMSERHVQSLYTKGMFKI